MSTSTAVRLVSGLLTWVKHVIGGRADVDRMGDSERTGSPETYNLAHGEECCFRPHLLGQPNRPPSR